MAYIVMAHIVMAYIVMAYIVMAYIVMAYIVMAYIVMAYIVMACTCRMSNCLDSKKYPRKKKCQTSTSDGDGRGGCPRGPGNRGGHGLSRVGDGSPCAARNPLVMPKNAPLRRLRTEGPHAEISDFSPGSLPRFSTSIDLPGDHWA